MISSSTLEILVLFTTVLAVSDAANLHHEPKHGHFEWNYLEKGPRTWAREVPTCGGQQQSPIDLVETEEAHGEKLVINFPSGSDQGEVTAKNNGHTVQFDIKLPSGGPVALFSGGGLNATYRFAQLHFHWGFYDGLGSEHTVHGQAHALEMHVVTFNQKYERIQEAIKHADGLAVFGTLFSAGEESFKPLKAIKPFQLELVQGIFSLERSMPLQEFFHLMDQDFSAFYRYHGSLTTPGCNEVVTWTVNDRIHTVDSRILHLFRAMTTRDQWGFETPLINNFRHVQRRNGRPVVLYHV